MSTALKYSITLESAMVLVDGKPHTVQKGQPNFADLRQALFEGRWDDVPDLLTVAKTIEDWTDGEFTVQDDYVMWGDEALPQALNDRILKMVSLGENPQPLMRFWERLQENPSYRSVQQLSAFLSKHPGIALTPEGHILFYKGVRDDFRDCHSGQFDNSPGQTPEMKRNRVSDDPDKACSFGFHVGSHAYATSFGTQVVICRVDPADVVCVPKDCDQQKVRVHRYYVRGVYSGETLTDTVLYEEIVDLRPSTDVIPPVNKGPQVHTDGSPLIKGETAPLPPKTDGNTTLPLNGTEWDAYNDMGAMDLMDLRIMALRAYARFNCLIVGASKMRGGKVTLVPAICKARGYGDPAERTTTTG